MNEKQQKYLVLSEIDLEELMNMAKDDGYVSVRLESAGKRWAGQLQYTKSYNEKCIARKNGFSTYKSYIRAQIEEDKQEAK